MAKAEKTKGAKAGAPRTKVPRIEKAVRKLAGTTAKTPFTMKTGKFTVTGFASVPTEVPGYLVERSATHTVWRHKKSSAAKQMVVSVFDNANILEVLGDEKGGSITVMQRKPFLSATGTLKFNGSDIVIKNDDGVSVFAPNSQVEYEIKALDLEGSQASNRGRSAGDKTVKGDKGDKKKGKVTDIKEGKKAKKK